MMQVAIEPVEPAESSITMPNPHTPGHFDLDSEPLEEQEEEEVEEDEQKIVNTDTLDEEQHAEDSIYVEEEERELPTPSGGPDSPERKTSEGNTTMC